MRFLEVVAVCLLVFLVCGAVNILHEVKADDQGPEITDVHHVPKYPLYGDDVTVYAAVSDPDKIKKVDMSYCQGDVCYFPVTMEDSDSDGVFSANIPWNSGWDNGTDIGYEINAVDNLDNQNSTGKIHFFFVSEVVVQAETPENLFLGETILLNGTAYYNDNESAPVEYSEVTLKVIGTELEYGNETDSLGRFSISLELENISTHNINITVTNRTLKGYYEMTFVVVGISFISEYLQTTTCQPNQNIWVNGSAKYSTGEPVAYSEIVTVINETLLWIGKTNDKGEYKILITAPAEVGQYAVNISIMNGSLKAYNETSLLVTQTPLTDLVVLDEDITFITETIPPLKNDEITIKVMVHNLGSADAAAISVSFYEGPPSEESLIDSDIISQIYYGSSSYANVTWFPSNGTYEIWIMVDPLNLIKESYEDNNNASKQIFVDNDFDGDRIGDRIDKNDDNDAIMDEDDAFPYDPTEWFDSDSDGTGDNADEDDDNDGYTDEREIEAGTDPLDPNSYPKGETNFFEKYGLFLILMIAVLVCMIVFTVILLRKKPANP